MCWDFGPLTFYDELDLYVGLLFWEYIEEEAGLDLFALEFEKLALWFWLWTTDWLTEPPVVWYLSPYIFFFD